MQIEWWLLLAAIIAFIVIVVGMKILAVVLCIWLLYKILDVITRPRKKDGDG